MLERGATSGAESRLFPLAAPSKRDAKGKKNRQEKRQALWLALLEGETLRLFAASCALMAGFVFGLRAIGVAGLLGRGYLRMLGIGGAAAAITRATFELARLGCFVVLGIAGLLVFCRAVGFVFGLAAALCIATLALSRLVSVMVLLAARLQVVARALGLVFVLRAALGVATLSAVVLCVGAVFVASLALAFLATSMVLFAACLQFAGAAGFVVVLGGAVGIATVAAATLCVATLVIAALTFAGFAFRMVLLAARLQIVRALGLVSRLAAAFGVGTLVLSR